MEGQGVLILEFPSVIFLKYWYGFHTNLPDLCINWSVHASGKVPQGNDEFEIHTTIYMAWTFTLLATYSSPHNCHHGLYTAVKFP